MFNFECIVPFFMLLLHFRIGVLSESHSLSTSGAVAVGLAP